MSDLNPNIEHPFDDELSSSFSNWDPQLPDGSWNELNESLDMHQALQQEDGLATMFSNWEPELPDSNWGQINASLDIHQALNHEDGLLTSFSNWNPEVPEESWAEISSNLDLHQALNQEDEEIYELWDPAAQGDFWTKLNTSISTITPEESSLREAYNQWQVEPNAETWDKIQESLEVERLWDRIKLSLYPNIKNNWFMRIAALFVILFITEYTSDSFRIMSSSKENLASQNPMGLSDAPRTSELTSTQHLAKAEPRPVNSFHVTSPQAQTQLLANFQIPSSAIALPLRNSQQNTTEAVHENERTDLSLLKLTPLRPLMIPLNHEFNLIAADDVHPTAVPRFRVGLYASNSVNLILRSVEDHENMYRSSYGYEIGIGASHPLSFLRQEYYLNYATISQYENNFKNGSYNEDKLKLNSIKFNTFSSMRIGQFAPGAGVSMMFPLSSYVTRGETVVGLPELNHFNLGYVVGLDFHNKIFFHRDNMVFGLKFEQIFATNKASSNFKSFQNLSFGIKFNF